MEELKKIFDVNYDGLKGNKNGAIVAIVAVTASTLLTLGKYAIDAIGKDSDIKE